MYELGEIDFYFSFFESVQISHLFLTEPEAAAYFKDLAIGILLCIVGGGSYVINSIKNTKRTGKSAPAPVEPVPMGIQSEENTEEQAPAEPEQEKQEDTVQH